MKLIDEKMQESGHFKSISETLQCKSLFQWFFKIEDFFFFVKEVIFEIGSYFLNY